MKYFFAQLLEISLKRMNYRESYNVLILLNYSNFVNYLIQIMQTQIL
jgi:hypothetical protein